MARIGATALPSTALALAVVSTIAAASLPSTAHAYPITFRFVGRATQVDSGQFKCPVSPLTPCRAGSRGMIVGDRFEGFITYETSVAANVLPDGAVDYTFSDSESDALIGVNDGEVLASALLVYVFDDALNTVDAIVIRRRGNPYSENDLFLEIIWPDNAGLDSSELPTSDIDLSGVQFARGRFSTDVGQQRRSLLFDIESFTVVPEPGTGLLLAGALGLLALVRRPPRIARA